MNNINNDYIFLLVGKSGSGKSTIEKMLENDGFAVVKSYTTREKRFSDEDTHEFVNEELYKQHKNDNEVCAYTLFDGNVYWATYSQVNNSDVYTVDKEGIKWLKNNSKLEKTPIVIYITASPLRRLIRMWKRSNLYDAIHRIQHDREEFVGIEFDVKIKNHNLEKAHKDVLDYIGYYSTHK